MNYLKAGKAAALAYVKPPLQFKFNASQGLSKIRKYSLVEPTVTTHVKSI